MNKLKKFGIATLTSATPFLFALAEGESIEGITTNIGSEKTPGAIADILTPWIEGGAKALLTVLTAGAVIVAIMFIWRLVKKGFNSAK